MKKTDFERWKRIAGQIEALRLKTIEIESYIQETVPKSVVGKRFGKILDELDKIKSDLEDRFSKEHPQKFTTDVFYGGEDSKRIKPLWYGRKHNFFDTRIKWGKLPDWYMKLTKGCSALAWEDHLGTVKPNRSILVDKSDVVTSEPYNRSMKAFKSLIKFCEKNNLGFTVSGRSPYYPGETFIIEIFKKEEEKQNG